MFPIASGLILAVAALAIGKVVQSDVTPAEFVPQLSSRLLNTSDAATFFRPASGNLDYDPNNYADEATWKKYVAKGGHLVCLMEATDGGAGFLKEDTRRPPSAASPFSGDLARKCRYILVDSLLTTKSAFSGAFKVVVVRRSH
jgi:hypothetical protein